MVCGRGVGFGGCKGVGCEGGVLLGCLLMLLGVLLSAGVFSLAPMVVVAMLMGAGSLLGGGGLVAPLAGCGVEGRISGGSDGCLLFLCFGDSFWRWALTFLQVWVFCLLLLGLLAVFL
ncbi:hypothetical protein U1Q18_014240 [Sarracenia purpurea var. burkii]